MAKPKPDPRRSLYKENITVAELVFNSHRVTVSLRPTLQVKEVDLSPRVVAVVVFVAVDA